MRSDRELFEAWCAGDKTGGNALFERHFDSLYRFFENKLPEHADELVQRTFLACVRSRDRFKHQCSFRTYMFTIARNELYQHFQRNRGHKLDFGVTSLADVQTSARTRLAHGEDYQRLLDALRSLPLDQQLLIELHYWEELTSTELGEVFEVAPATARTRLFRARQALRDQLEQTADQPRDPGSLDDLDAWARALRADRDSSRRG